ncbi:hypothetical protein WJX81_001758 [Elliptochloris bilobata]|uniref:PSII 6.1 kDa protein n=1 Tax=Elliptochloris bilobata TaxID=381761 RepID=A0AAW1SCN7_9CHLO
MQAVVCSSASAIKGVSVSRNSAAARPVARAPVVCHHNVAKRAAAAAATLPAMLVAHPAMALVDQRLAGEGTGKILGVGGPEGIAIVVVFGLIWALCLSEILWDKVNTALRLGRGSCAGVLGAGCVRASNVEAQGRLARRLY